MVSPERLKHVNIALPSTSYSIDVGRHLLEDAASFSHLIAGHQVLIVTNQTIAPLYLAPLQRACQQYQCHIVVLPDGEAHKTQASITAIHEALIQHRHDSSTTVIALGGGVISDLTGFAASTYHRGVACLHVPTTLLAMVDAAVGGKTAINYPNAKNAVGTFHQPAGVVMDLAVLDTLPKRELQAGFGEVIKYGVLSGDLSLSQQPLPDLIARCCEIKADFIRDDINDKKGRRALLNLGHTFAHALEAYTEYQAWLHGEAVAIGLYYAALLSYQVGELSLGVLEQIDDVLGTHRLPRRIPKAIDAEALYALMLQDKKVTNQKLSFILIKALGACYMSHHITQTQMMDLLRT